MIRAYGPPRQDEQTPRGTAWDFSDSVFSIGPTGIAENDRSRVKDYSLKILQNPIMSSNTKIRYSLPRGSTVKISIYNTLGQCEDILVDGFMVPGIYELTSDRTLPSGIYFIQLSSPDKTITQKFIILR